VARRHSTALSRRQEKPGRNESQGIATHCSFMGDLVETARDPGTSIVVTPCSSGVHRIQGARGFTLP
jgi:hypothetical protein